METKFIVSTVPVKQIKEKRIANTLYGHYNILTTLCIMTVAGYLGQRVIGGSGVRMEAIFLFAYLAYFLLYKRRTYWFLTEDSIYFVKNGTATHIPWERITSAWVIHKSVWNYIGFAVSGEVSAALLLTKEKERCFRQEPKVTACFRHHMQVEGLSGK